MSAAYDLFQQGRSASPRRHARAGDRGAREGEAARAGEGIDPRGARDRLLPASPAGRRRRRSSARCSSSRPPTTTRTTRSAARCGTRDASTRPATHLKLARSLRPRRAGRAVASSAIRARGRRRPTRSGGSGRAAARWNASRYASAASSSSVEAYASRISSSRSAIASTTSWKSPYDSSALSRPARTQASSASSASSRSSASSVANSVELPLDELVERGRAGSLTRAPRRGRDAPRAAASQVSVSRARSGALAGRRERGGSSSSPRSARPERRRRLLAGRRGPPRSARRPRRARRRRTRPRARPHRVPAGARPTGRAPRGRGRSQPSPPRAPARARRARGSRAAIRPDRRPRPERVERDARVARDEETGVRDGEDGLDRVGEALVRPDHAGREDGATVVRARWVAPEDRVGDHPQPLGRRRRTRRASRGRAPSGRRSRSNRAKSAPPQPRAPGRAARQEVVRREDERRPCAEQRDVELGRREPLEVEHVGLSRAGGGASRAGCSSAFTASRGGRRSIRLERG